mgnify:CR=1 FL=1
MDKKDKKEPMYALWMMAGFLIIAAIIFFFAYQAIFG